MKISALFLCLIAFTVSAGDHVIIYARLMKKTPVHLSNGAEWVMDEGDCFPIIAYKEAHSKIILKLEDSRFTVDAKLTREVEPNELATAEASYRTNVNTYLNGADGKLHLTEEERASQ